VVSAQRRQRRQRRALQKWRITVTVTVTDRSASRQSRAASGDLSTWLKPYLNV
jgi:hypothetical protein